MTYLMGDYKPSPKRDKQSSPKHEDWIKTLDCFVCLKPSQSMCAHVRQGHYAMSDKPGSDCTVPLCGGCHQNSPYAQHRMNERQWWIQNGFYNIHAGARHLFENTGDIDAFTEAREIAR